VNDPSGIRIGNEILRFVQNDISLAASSEAKRIMKVAVPVFVSLRRGKPATAKQTSAAGQKKSCPPFSVFRLVLSVLGLPRFIGVAFFRGMLRFSR